MIKFGDINILGVFLGDTPITSAYSGSELVYSSRPKYPANSSVFRYETQYAGANYFNVPFHGDSKKIPCTVDWGDGQVEEFDGSTEISQHLYNAQKEGLLYDITIIYKDDIKRTYNNFTTYSFITEVLHSPENKSINYKSWLEDDNPVTYYGFILKDPNVDPTRPSYIKCWRLDKDYHDDPNDEYRKLTIGAFPADGLRIEFPGNTDNYWKGWISVVNCEPDFKPVSPSGNRFYIELANNSRVREVNGLDASRIKLEGSILLLLNNYILKISHLKLGTSTKLISYYFNNYATVLDKLVFLEIDNLGEYAIQGQTIDLSMFIAWGDETKAAELGVTGARQSLLDTLVNKSFDVNGKEIKLKLPKSVKARLNAQAIAAIEAKGYIIPKYDLNATVFEMTTTASNQTVDVPLTSYGVCTVDWGDNTTESLNCNSVIHHTYKDAGKYITLILPNAPLSSEANITGGQDDYKLQYITKFIQLSNTYKYSRFDLRSRYYNYPSDTYYTRHQPNLKETPIIKVNLRQVGITTGAVDNSVNKGTFVIHPQLKAADVYLVIVCGQYDTVKFADNFKTPSNQSFNLFLDKTTSDEILSLVTLILGPANFKGALSSVGLINGDMNALLNLRKIESISLGNITNDRFNLFNMSVETPNLVFLHITNLGENIPQTLTYDFTYHTNWGNEQKAAEFGITGARESLHNTIMDALDVTGKNVTLEFAPSVMGLITDEEIESLQAKGYNISKYGLNATVFEVTTTKPNTEFYLPLLNFGQCNINWGDGSEESVNIGSYSEYNHTYAEPGVYKCIVTDNGLLKLNAELKSYSLRDESMITLLIQLSKSYDNYNLYITANASPNPNLSKTPIGYKDANSRGTSTNMYIYAEAQQDSVNHTLKVFKVRANSNNLLIFGHYYDVIFDDNFEIILDSLQNYLTISLLNGNKVHRILGNLNFKNTETKSEIFSGKLVADLYLVEKLTLPDRYYLYNQYTMRIIDEYVESEVNITYLYITNLGDYNSGNFTYDFTNIPHWGDEELAATQGIVGARESLHRTIVDALDVNGKDIKLKISDEVFNRLTEEEINILKSKGYIVYLINILKLKYVTNKANLTVSLPFLKNDYPEAKVEWGDGTVETPNRMLQHTYATPGEYIVKVFNLNLDTFSSEETFLDKLRAILSLPKSMIYLDVYPDSGVIPMFLSEMGGPVYDNIIGASLYSNANEIIYEIACPTKVFTIKSFKSLKKPINFRVRFAYNEAKEIHFDNYVTTNLIEQYQYSDSFDFRGDPRPQIEKVTGTCTLVGNQSGPFILPDTTLYFEKIKINENTKGNSEQVLHLFGGGESKKLANCTIEGIGLASISNYDLVPMVSWGDDTIYPGAKKSMIDSLITYSATVSGVTITLATAAYNRLTSDEIALIKAKGYTLNHL